jgi:hypothetical protein
LFDNGYFYCVLRFTQCFTYFCYILDHLTSPGLAYSQILLVRIYEPLVPINTVISWIQLAELNPCTTCTMYISLTIFLFRSGIAFYFHLFSTVQVTATASFLSKLRAKKVEQLRNSSYNSFNKWRLTGNFENEIPELDCGMGVSDTCMYNYRNAIYREWILIIKEILINKP